MENKPIFKPNPSLNLLDRTSKGLISCLPRDVKFGIHCEFEPGDLFFLPEFALIGCNIAILYTVWCHFPPR